MKAKRWIVWCRNLEPLPSGKLGGWWKADPEGPIELTLSEAGEQAQSRARRAFHYGTQVAYTSAPEGTDPNTSLVAMEYVR